MGVIKKYKHHAADNNGYKRVELKKWQVNKNGKYESNKFSNKSL